MWEAVESSCWLVVIVSATLVGLLAMWVTFNEPKTKKAQYFWMAIFAALSGIGIIAAIVEHRANAREQIGQRREQSNQFNKLTADLRGAKRDLSETKKVADSLAGQVQILQGQLAAAKGELSASITNSEKTVNTNISQYRSDTTNAVSKLLRPPRSLTVEQRAKLIDALRRAGPHALGIRHSDGNAESQAFADELTEALVAARWTQTRAQFFISLHETFGVRILVSSIKAPPDGAIQLQQALLSIGIRADGEEAPFNNKDEFDLMVGLQ